MKFGVGQSIRRKEDDPLLRGPGVISPTRRRMARCTLWWCVRRTLTRDQARCRGARPCQVCGSSSPATTWWRRPDADAGRIPGVDIAVPRYPVLAQGEVRHVGDAVAFVVADTPERAKDAAEASISNGSRARNDRSGGGAGEGAVQVWPDRPGNLAFEVALGDRAPTAKAMRAHRAPCP